MNYTSIWNDATQIKNIHTFVLSNEFASVSSYDAKSIKAMHIWKIMMIIPSIQNNLYLQIHLTSTDRIRFILNQNYNKATN